MDLQIGEGALEQANVLKSLVSRLLADPGLGQLVAGSIRDVAPDALEGDRTPFEAIDMALEIADGAIRAKDVSMKTSDFALQTAGTVGLDGAISADGTIRFSEDLSRKILAKADRLGPILSDGDTVAIPLRFGGTTDAPSLVPDLAALSEKATDGAKEELTNRAAKELGDALFGKKHEDDPEDAARDADRDETESRIKEGLGRFLGR